MLYFTFMRFSELTCNIQTYIMIERKR